ncbi:DUF3606 domain-containing protein [Castellaniella ginsengisoli]|uniref:DUF3606 domain-containing protein n=1 Tax=Castellaniella ginsengisoli TaxID=546114 RepID=A0AB39CWY3_9BURK
MDNLKIRQPQDPKQINLNEPWEVRGWCKTLGVTEAKLKEAVKAVGTQVAAVKKYLGK